MEINCMGVSKVAARGLCMPSTVICVAYSLKSAGSLSSCLSHISGVAAISVAGGTDCFYSLFIYLAKSANFEPLPSFKILITLSLTFESRRPPRCTSSSISSKARPANRDGSPSLSYSAWKPRWLRELKPIACAYSR